MNLRGLVVVALCVVEIKLVAYLCKGVDGFMGFRFVE